MDSPKDLPPWPPQLRIGTDGSFGTYGDVKFHPEMHMSMLVARQSDLIAALRARLALALDVMADEADWCRHECREAQAKAIERVIEACREPS